MSDRGSHQVSAGNSLKTIEGLVRTSVSRSSVHLDFNQYARSHLLDAYWCGLMPRHGASGEMGSGWGRALARHHLMDVNDLDGSRASDLSVPLGGGPAFVLREQVHRLDIWRCQAVCLFLM